MSQTSPRAAIEAGRADEHRRWETVKDLIDQNIDLMLNFRQSGHPGGSRSKVHVLVATLLGGHMRWDLRHPEKRFADRFILVAGHTAPLIYGTLPVFHEALRIKHRRTGDPRYAVPDAARRALYPEDLITFRRHGGLPGHAEMEGKTLFFKFNTGPSGHGSPPAAGQAMALKRAGAGEVRVFAFEGEGGLTAGASHETKNSAWGLGLDNLVYVIDWNDFGIDDHAVSSVVHGTPRDWFEPYGWRVVEAGDGSDWTRVDAALTELLRGENPARVPGMVYVRTRKGRGYLKYDHASHGSPHAPPNSETFWETKRAFAETYGVDFEGFGQPAPADPEEFRRQTLANLAKVAEVLQRQDGLVDYLAETLVRIGDSVPESIPGFRLHPAGKAKGNPWKDPELTDAAGYPPEMWAKPGDKQPNRAALGRWGAWANAWAREKYGRPLFLALSADLAESTNLAGFAKDFGALPGWGKYERNTNPEGGGPPPPGDHGVHELRPRGGDRHGQPLRAPVRGVGRIRGRLLHVRFVQLPEVRSDAPLQPAGAGLPDPRRAGHMDRRALRPRNGRRLPDPLRRLRPGRDPALPPRARDRPAPVGVQRGAGRPGGRARGRGADPGAAPDPPGHRRAGPGRARAGVALRGGARSVRAAAVP